MTDIEYIASKLSREDSLCQLAKEAAEVSQAALKLRRVLDKTNPTPIDAETAKNKLLEEIADVVITLDVMMGDADWNVIWAFSVRKLDRWVERLKGTANTNCAADAPTVAPTDALTAGGRTRQEKFLELFPRADAHTGVLGVCPGDIDVRYTCRGPKDCADCKKEYWLAAEKEGKS